MASWAAPEPRDPRWPPRRPRRRQVRLSCGCAPLSETVCAPTREASAMASGRLTVAAAWSADNGSLRLTLGAEHPMRAVRPPHARHPRRSNPNSDIADRSARSRSTCRRRSAIAASAGHRGAPSRRATPAGIPLVPLPRRRRPRPRPSPDWTRYPAISLSAPSGPWSVAGCSLTRSSRRDRRPVCPL